MLTIVTARHKHVASQLVRLAVLSVPGRRPLRIRGCLLVEAMEVQCLVRRDFQRVVVGLVVGVVVRLGGIADVSSALDELPTRKLCNRLRRIETLPNSALDSVVDVVLDVALRIAAVVQLVPASVAHVAKRPGDAARTLIEVRNPRMLTVVVTLVIVAVVLRPDVDAHFAQAAHVV